MDFFEVEIEIEIENLQTNFVMLSLIFLFAMSWTTAETPTYQSYENSFTINNWNTPESKNSISQQSTKFLPQLEQESVSDSLQNKKTDVLPNAAFDDKNKNARKNNPKFNITSGVEHFIFVGDYK